MVIGTANGGTSSRVAAKAGNDRPPQGKELHSSSILSYQAKALAALVSTTRRTDSGGDQILDLLLRLAGWDRNLQAQSPVLQVYSVGAFGGLLPRAGLL